jgi:hypothetical protein
MLPLKKRLKKGIYTHNLGGKLQWQKNQKKQESK